MKLVAWNVNSIRARHDRVLAFLEREQPDALCLQETKVTDDVFPFDALRDAGYHAAAYGQRTYNGVALITRSEPQNVTLGFDDGDEEDPQTRLIAADVDGVRVISAYFPNGKTVGSDKWDYKLAWMERLRAYLGRLDPAQPVALCGDYNVAPDDARDMANPERWQGGVLAHEKARAGVAALRDWGLMDAVRLIDHGPGPWTWWDYRSLGFQRGDGLRIDHIYVTPPLARRVVDAYVDRDERRDTSSQEGGSKPSDHAPLIVVVD
jgi:exodeoxyribonuclease-3